MVALTTIRSKAGIPFTVASDYAPRFQNLIDGLESAGYPLSADQSGGYNPRMIQGTNTPSEHAFGRAIDVNWTDNPKGGSNPTLPADLARDVAKNNGFTWGGDWSGKDYDPMHFQIDPNWTQPTQGGNIAAGAAPGFPRRMALGGPQANTAPTAPLQPQPATGGQPMAGPNTNGILSPPQLPNQDDYASQLKGILGQLNSPSNQIGDALMQMGGGLLSHATGAHGGWGPGLGAGFQNVNQGVQGNQQNRMGLLEQLATMQARQQQLALANRPQLADVGYNAIGLPTKAWVNPSTQEITPLPANAGQMGGTQSPNENLTGDDLLKTLDKPTASQVKALAEGRMQFPAGFALKSPYWQNMIRMVSQYDPSFDAVNYGARAKTRNDFTSGKSAQSIAALNTVIGHIGTLSDKGDALDNGDYPAFNAVRNLARDQTGDPRIKTFNTSKKAVVDELTRVWRGSGGAEGDIKTWSDQINASSSPAQLHEVLGNVGDLLTSRLDALKEQYKTGMGTMDQGREFLTPGSTAALDRIRGRKPQQADVAAPAPPAVPAFDPSAFTVRRIR